MPELNPGHAMHADKLKKASKFNAKDWIGQGRKYKDVPTDVVIARIKLLALPSELHLQLPSSDIPIPEFINLSLPTQSASLNTFHTDQWFGQQEPATDPEKAYTLVTRRTIPSLATLDQLEGAFGQKWFDGAKSIRDPRYNQGRDQLPLWVLTLWRTLHNLIKDQQNWREAYQYVSNWTKSPVVATKFPTPESVFGSRGWNADVMHGGFVFTTVKFAQLLQNRQLCDDITQVMTHRLQSRLETQGDKGRGHLIVASRFYLVLEALTRPKFKNSEKLPLSLAAVEEAVQQNPDLKLWFPVLHRQHEVAVCIDFKARTLVYGDCPLTLRYCYLHGNR